MARLRPERSARAKSIVHGFVRVEDAVYAGLGTLLAGLAFVLLVAVAVAFVRALLGHTLPDHAVIVALVGLFVMLSKRPTRADG